MWWCAPIPRTREDEFRTTLGYTVRPCPTTNPEDTYHGTFNYLFINYLRFEKTRSHHVALSD